VRAKVTCDSRELKDLVGKIEGRTNPYMSSGSERLTLECFDPAIPELAKQRLVDAIAHKVFLPLKSRVEDLNPQDQNFYKSFNCYRRQVLFPEGTRLGLGIFAHADCMHYLSPNASKKYFVKEYPPVETASSEARIAIPATRKVVAGSASLFASEGTQTPPDLSLVSLSMEEPIAVAVSVAVSALSSKAVADMSRKRGAFTKKALASSETPLNKRVAFQRVAFQKAGGKVDQNLGSIVS
jgi:hypothetical protein